MSDLAWQNDVTLPTELQAKYEAYKVAYRAAKALREAFEGATVAAFKPHIPAGSTLAFSYNFGKLGVAIAPERKAKTQPKATQISLSDWLLQNEQIGVRS